LGRLAGCVKKTTVVNKDWRVAGQLQYGRNCTFAVKKSNLLGKSCWKANGGEQSDIQNHGLGEVQVWL
jgi:hypothetical protein